MRKRMLFHFHTHHSVDSNLAPKTIVDFAVKNGIEILAPTDHNAILGSREIKTLAEAHGITTIVGAEFNTDHGDVIGLFLQDDIYSRKASEVVAEIHNQGGLAVIPHPYRSHHLTDEFLHSCDGIEVFNSRLSPQLNGLAVDLAREIKKPIFYGADAHLDGELGLVVAEIELKDGESMISAVSRGMTPITLERSGLENIYRSQMIASAKRGTPVRYCKSFVGYLRAKLKRSHGA